MKSRYSGRRRRSYKRRPRGRIVRPKRRMNRPDQGYSEKIVKLVTLNANTSYGRSSTFQTHAVAWFPAPTTASLIADCGSAPNLSTGFSENQQWTSLNEMWSRYVPSGMKIKFMPSASVNSTIGSINVGTIMGYQQTAYGLNDIIEGNDTLARVLDTKTYNPRSGFKRYYKISKNWKHTNSRGSASMDDKFDKQPVTVINFEGNSLDSTDALGSLKITWYYRFKNRTIA